jgi:hypothetical protein
MVTNGDGDGEGFIYIILFICFFRLTFNDKLY